MLNGISEIARRPDLLNRSIVLRLPPIKSRKTDRELEQQFEEVWPFVLGALLDAACIGLSNLESVPTESLPRMADFSRWIIACEDALPWDSGTFLDAYRENVQQAAGALLREEPVFIVFERFMKKRKSVDGVFYEGTPTGLLEQLELFENNDENALPKTANWLMKKFERLNPPIRLELGVEIVHDKRTKDQRSVTVRQVERPGSKPTNQTTRGTS